MRTEKEQTLPEYAIRYSRRARRIRITVAPESGVTVTLPAGASSASIPKLLEEKRAWLSRALRNANEARQLKSERLREAEKLPERLTLPAIGIDLPIRYRPNAAANRAVRSQDEVMVSYRGHEAAEARQALRRLLLREARSAYLPALEQFAAEMGVRFSSLSVRGQKRRWGSCSARGALSLNFKLLFLPPELFRHVLLHELAHIRHPDHSRRFYDFLGRFDAGLKHHHRELKKAGNSLPAWLELI